MATITANFSKIIIIQSLKEGRTGSRLQDDLSVLTIFTDGLVCSELIDVNTKEELMSLLSTINLDVRAGKYRPIIHIEAHGSIDNSGLVLASPGNFVSWREIKGPLADINVATGLNLLVCLSACYGAYMTSAIETIDRAPCWALVGPKGKMYPDDLLKDFTGFYDEILRTRNGGAALKRLYRDKIGSESLYFFTTAEMFFETVWINYIRKNCNDDQLNNRTNAMVRELKKRGMKNVPSRNELKAKLMQSHPDFFIKSKEYYFMMDLFEENKERFAMDYESIIQKAQLD